MPNKYLDSVQLGRLITKIKTLVSTTVAGYLPLAGGSITGNLSVSGTITGDVTGDLTGNADTATTATTATNATNATNDANGNPIASTYLPLSGGTMTGNITGGHLFSVQNSADNDSTRVFGASAWNKGAGLNLWGKDHVDYPGVFSLYAHDGTNTKQLTGKTDGTLTWNSKNIIVASQNILAGTTSATTVAGNNTATVNVSFGITFASVPKVVASCSISYAGVYAGVVSVTTTGCVIRFNNTTNSSRSLTADWIAIAI